MQYNNLLLLCLLLVSCGNNTSSNLECATVHDQVNKEQLRLDAPKGIVFFKNDPFCGVSVVFQNNIKVASTEYLHGKKNGPTLKWFLSGVLSYETHYINGKQDGFSKTWWKNGQLRSQSNFENGIAHGEQLSWYQSGKLFKKVNLDHGKELGLQQAWRENGKIYNNYEAKNGRIFGLKRAGLCFELEEENLQ